MAISRAEYFDEDTLFKVYDSLRTAGLSEDESRECIRDMQNKGLLFREFPPEAKPQTVYRGGSVASIPERSG